MSTSRLHQLSERGQSVWVDTLSREMIESGELKRLIEEDAVVGVTSNPSIFQKALSHGNEYDDQLRDCLEELDDPKEIFLHLATGDGLAFLDVQDAWYRHFAGPLGGIWDGIVAAFEGARQLLSGSRDHVYFHQAGGDPYRVASMNLMLFGFLAFALAACVGIFRRLPRAYGVYVAAALVLPLSFPVGPQPLMSLPRFLAVLFPLFMWLALVCEERRITARAVGASALGLGLFTAQFATWHFIS